MQDPNAEILEFAHNFIEQTGRNLFVTGKAGSGKTYFLNQQSKRTSKKHLILASTGIAAINAGGITINSLFQLPPGTYLPENAGQLSNVYKISTLLENINYSQAKHKLLRNVELIFIDEVSMLRSDQVAVMDAILKKERNNSLPFGGVQIVFIGDLYQLPPVLPNDLVALYTQYYSSEFFFDSDVIRGNPLLQIELSNIHRQSDQNFIDILNRIRTNESTSTDLIELNKRVTDQTDERYLTHITSHIEDAALINSRKLSSLPGETRQYESVVIGDFKESNGSAEKLLTLKIGAQVMLIRNDTKSLKEYYNGKTGEVTFLADNNVGVRFEDGREIDVERSTWQSLDYSSGSAEVVGELHQFPLKLAWAVTIHKSQGLTFERAVIDAGRSFAAGQVYVAVSRIKSLDGLKLQTPLTKESILTNPIVSEYLKPTSPLEFSKILDVSKTSYWLQKMMYQFNVADEHSQAMEILNKPNTYKQRINTKVLVLIEDSAETLKSLRKVWEKFSDQAKTHYTSILEIQWLEERVEKAIKYFTQTLSTIISKLASYDGEKNDLSSSLLAAIKSSLESRNKQISQTRQWVGILKTEGIDKSLEAITTIETATLAPKIEETVASAKRNKGTSALRTADLFLSGKSIIEISLSRKLPISTIENHLLEVAKSEQSVIRAIVNEDDLSTMRVRIAKVGPDLADLKEFFGDRYTFFQLRLGIANSNFGRQND
jgi:ATP-dependent DNA helicase PIF1